LDSAYHELCAGSVPPTALQHSQPYWYKMKHTHIIMKPEWTDWLIQKKKEWFKISKKWILRGVVHLLQVWWSQLNSSLNTNLGFLVRRSRSKNSGAELNPLFGEL
jgi:hypothetical protein